MSILDSLQARKFRVSEQLRQANVRERGEYPVVTCYQHSLPFPTYPLWKMYRCFHCGEFFCEQCSKEHFGERSKAIEEKETK